MPLEYVIEVCVESGASTTAKGAILERFVAAFLHTQNFGVTSNIRVTGMEVDLLARDRSTGEEIIVECKAHRSNIAADVITKLLGNVDVRDVQAGWLITTHALGKDAKGIEVEWDKRSVERRRRLRIYSPEKLIDRLERARVITPAPQSIPLTSQYKIGGEAYLILSERGYFWAIPLIDAKNGVTAAVDVYNAKEGTRVTSEDLLTWLSQLDSSLGNLDWTPVGGESPTAAALRDELDHIVAVPMAEHWADYRPSRPSDFVGRETIQREVFEFFDRVRAGETKTRLLALKAPSGWGKSSSVLKIADRAGNKRNKGRYFVHTIDSRAALTSRFPELAVISAVRAAIAAQFVQPKRAVEFGIAGNLLSTSGTAELLHLLAEQEKVIVVFFDQFEELLYKDELADVFDQMRVICNAIEAAQANVIIGFSWKTDGTITTEHGAYHLWHGLADRRFEIDLPPFSDKEVALEYP
ncbi:restriction endonuclease [Sphingobium sp. D43FB]|uniref:restriction endonuclease n=1 Tax=Sphingobium sp. D43FB TaxID=2017595 RepID=UPI000BB53F25|nr:restriction endonuclease [Sphingobium sp. D43FB]PBN42501.1 hypothetical protein SxD43FB_16400 [Sphingobium sp. D43FB]